MSKRSIFISYSHADETWKDLLEKQLRALEQQGMFEVWTDREIGAGENWYEKIENALQNAWVAILLISDNSLTSDFILNEEVVRLLKRRDEEELRIIPIIIRDCPWKLVGWLRRMQIRPRDGRALEKMKKSSVRTELMNIVIEIAEIAQATNPTSSESRAEVSNRARPESIPKTLEAEDLDSLKKEQELEAKLMMIKKELDELRNKHVSQSKSTSESAIINQEGPAKQFKEVSQQTTSSSKTLAPKRKVNAKKDR